MDIDAVTLLGSEFDNNGKYVIWSPLADISTRENLAASQTMPFPTGKEARIPIDDKSDSWFTIYDNYIGELFDVEKDTITRSDGTESIVDLKGKDGSNVLKLKTLTPEKIKSLSEFIREVNKNGLPLKGIITEDGNWKPTQTLMDEWINAHELDDGIV